MEREYKNAGDTTLTWVYLQRPDGRTLELDPGETVTLDLPDDFEDALLVPVTVVSDPPKRARAKATTFPPFAPPIEQEQVENA